MTDHPQKPMTHTLWTPLFDDNGKFLFSREIGSGFIETDANGAVTCHTYRHCNPVGYDCGFAWLLPNGQEPPAPPAEILEDALYDWQERRKAEGASR